MSSSPPITVQAYQNLSPWTAHNSPVSSRSPLRLTTTSQLFQSLNSNVVPQLSHSHPDQPRWHRRGGTRLRHVHDPTPFEIVEYEPETIQPVLREQMEWIFKHFKATSVSNSFPYIIVSTATPPSPVPLTVGGRPAIFCLPSQTVEYLRGDTYHSDPRFPDPCSHIPRSPFFPDKTESVEILRALAPLMNIQAITFSEAHILVELVHGDGREYDRRSLPGKVAGRPTTYHHSSEPFLATIQNLARQRTLDPAPYLPGPHIGPLPQDATNYLNEPHVGKLSPGVRVASGHWTEQGEYTNVIASTTCGVRLRKGTQDVVTVANHGFLSSTEVYHPDPAAGGVVIGQIVDRYPELDIAMVKLAPAYQTRFTNESYFQAQPSKRLIGGGATQWELYEVDGMSTGLISLCLEATQLRQPIRPPGHPEIDFNRWCFNRIHRVFGGVGSYLKDGICGAPIVQLETGAVGGFFHLLEGDGWAVSATLDDLIAEGYEVV